MKTINNFMHT